MTDLAAALSSLKPNNTAIAAAVSAITKSVDETGAARAANTVASQFIDATSDDALVPLLGVLQKLFDNKSDGAVEFREAFQALLPACFRKMAPKGDATASPLQKQALAVLKGWKQLSLLPPELLAKLTDILKKKEVKEEATTTAPADADAAGSVDVVGPETVAVKVPTIADVRKHVTTLTALRNSLSKLPANRRDHFVACIESHKRAKGTQRLRRDDEDTLALLSAVAEEAAREVAKISASNFGSGPSGSSSIVKSEGDGSSRVDGIAKVLDKARQKDETAAADDAKRNVAVYKTISSPSLLRCDVQPPHENRHPWTAVGRSPFALRGGKKQALAWGPTSVDWLRAKEMTSIEVTMSLEGLAGYGGSGDMSEEAGIGVKRNRDGTVVH